MELNDYSAANLRKLRSNKEMSRQELASHLAEFGIHLHVNSLKRIEDGDQPMKLQEAVAFSKVFQIELEDFVFSPVDVIGAEIWQRQVLLREGIAVVFDDLNQLRAVLVEVEQFLQREDLPIEEQSKAMEMLNFLYRKADEANGLASPAFDYMEDWLLGGAKKDAEG